MKDTMQTVITLLPGESYVVGTIEFWDGIVDIFKQLANEFPVGSAEYESWRLTIDEVESQIIRNGHLVDDVEWNGDEDLIW